MYRRKNVAVHAMNTKFRCSMNKEIEFTSQKYEELTRKIWLQRKITKEIN